MVKDTLELHLVTSNLKTLEILWYTSPMMQFRRIAKIMDTIKTETKFPTINFKSILASMSLKDSSNSIKSIKKWELCV